jgi:hypothetical protein
MEPSLESNVAVWDDPRFPRQILCIALNLRVEFARSVLSNWKSNESLVTAIYGPRGEAVKLGLLKKIEETTCSVGKHYNLPLFLLGSTRANAQIAAEFFGSILKVLDSPEDRSEKSRQRATLWRKSSAKRFTIGQIGVLARLDPAWGIPLPVSRGPWSR